MIQLREDQARALEDLRATARQGVMRIVLASPTGSGKTVIAGAIASSALAKGKRLSFVVPMIGLIDQTVRMFFEAGVTDIGVVQQSHQLTNWSRSVQICSVQTLASRRHVPDADMAVFDEVHLLHKWHLHWLGLPEWAGKPIIGLSATPWTRGLGKHFSTLLTVSTTAQMIKQGILSPFKVFSVASADLSQIRTVAGDYHQGELSETMQRDGALTADIVRTWQKEWGKDKTLCFAVDLAHARQLHARFSEAGVIAAYQDAATPTGEREALRAKFNRGEVRIIVSVGTLTTGADLDVRCISFCRPTKSEMLYVQMIGRGLRRAAGKDHLLLLDHTECTSKLGFVTDIVYDRLDDGTKKSEAKKRDKPVPRPCEACGYIPFLRERKCSNCGFDKPLPISPHVERDGALVEMTGGRRAGNGQLIEYTVAEKKAFFAQLMFVGAERRYKDGWAAVQFREKFGAWPPYSWKTMVPPAAPGPLVLSWVKSRMIRFAKRRAGNGQAVP